MSSTPLVSIVTPSYNTGRFIGDAVESVLSQDYPNVEYFVMDGGSTDDTVAELKRFGPRVQWTSAPDGGQSDALNQGFAKAKGSIFGWLNSDDTYAPGAVSASVEFLQQHPEVDAVYGDANFIDADGNDIAPCANVEPFNRHRLLHYTDFIVQPTVFFRRSAYEAVGGIDNDLHWCMDYDLWLKMVAKGLTIAYLPRHLANFRWLVDNKTATGQWGRLNEIEKVVARYAGGTHAYLRLEMVNLHLQEAKRKFKALHLLGTTASMLRAGKTYLTSARAIRSTFQRQTWKIVYTGQVLRKRAVAAQTSTPVPTSQQPQAAPQAAPQPAPATPAPQPVTSARV